MRRLARTLNGVVVTNLIPDGIAALNKFIVYHLHPEARYSVTLLATAERYKISVGSNPWAPVPRTHDIAKLCEKHGGGGHPAVGAISLPKDDQAKAERLAARSPNLYGKGMGISRVVRSARSARLRATLAMRRSSL